MSLYQETLDRLAQALDTPSPEQDANGDAVFELADALRLAVRELPGGEGCVLWAEVSRAVPPADAAARDRSAREILRLRFARLAGSPDCGVTLNETGDAVLFSVLRSDSETDLEKAAGALLDEAEAMRKGLRRSAPPPVGGGFPLPDLRSFAWR